MVMDGRAIDCWLVIHMVSDTHAKWIGILMSMN